MGEKPKPRPKKWNNFFFYTLGREKKAEWQTIVQVMKSTRLPVQMMQLVSVL
jgi:hypothetical protein